MFEPSGYKSPIVNADGKRGCIKRVYEKKIKPVADQFGVDLYIFPETIISGGGMYKESGWWNCWSSNHERVNGGERNGKIIISDMANRELSDDGLEGLMCLEASRIILYHMASGFGQKVYRQIRALSPTDENLRLNGMQKVLFDINKLVPAMSETINIDRKEHWRFREDWIRKNSEYLNELSKTMPEIAAEILKRIEFEDELRLDLQH